MQLLIKIIVTSGGDIKNSNKRSKKEFTQKKQYDILGA